MLTLFPDCCVPQTDETAAVQ